jgi:hypothetical protein
MATTDLQKYNANYYKSNSGDILKHRRSRYSKDKCFRNKAKKNSLDRYRESTKDKEPIDRMVISGYFTIGRLAKFLNKSVHTIRFYHRKRINKTTKKVIHRQVIPDVTNVDRRGWRLYTMDQVKLLVRVFKQFDNGDIETLNAVGEILKQEWK